MTTGPCHSIHCRHYDLANGYVCNVQLARDAERAAYAEGFAAGKSGAGTSACCWIPDSPHGMAWFAGWEAGRNSIKRSA